MLLKYLKFGLLICGVVALYVDAAQAAEPVLIKESGSWSAYTLLENGQKICYMVSSPSDVKGKFDARGKVYALITHRPAQNTRDVFTYISGYPYKENSSASALVDGQKFFLVTQDDTAWTPDATADAKMIGAIRKGSRFVVQGVSARGNAVTDTYSLKGSGEVYAAISKACGINP